LGFNNDFLNYIKYFFILSNARFLIFILCFIFFSYYRTDINIKITKFNLSLESVLFLTVSSLIVYALIYNLFHYNPIFGYDGQAHHAYVENFLKMYIPGETNKPASSFTYEFFSPPLPYVLPSLINEVCISFSTAENYLDYCQNLYGFINIFFLSLVYIGLLFMYMKIVKKVLKINKIQSTTTLLVLGLFSINYKAISMIRAEVYILFFSAFLIYRFLLLIEKSYIYEIKDIAIFGSTIGLLALSRQWAFLLFPAYFVVVFFIEKKYRMSYLHFLIFSFMVGFTVSSWFYFGLYIDYGSFTSFNMESSSFSFSNQPQSFYIPPSEVVSYLFSKPIRPYLENAFLPILYSDLWGDYWGYFSFTSNSLDTGRNQLLIGDYLARVNIFSIFPSLLLIFGFKNSLKSVKIKSKTTYDLLNVYITFGILFSFFGYLWFLISYPESTGDTAKSTYLIQLFHLLGLVTVLYVEKLRIINNKYYIFIQASLVLVFIHNFQTMLSHFPKPNLL
jgi:hypothetical protein